MRNFILSLMVGAIVLLFGGCATTTLETSTKLTRSIILDHSTSRENDIYIQVTNTANSGGEKMHLEENIKKELIKKGYKIVNSSKDAKLGLFVNVLFANNLKEANAVVAASGLGITSGVIAMGAGSSTGDSLLIGAAAALTGAVVAKALEDETFKAVIDLTIKDYIDNSERKSRIFSKAVKMNLDLEEALPVLENEAIKSIANIF